MIRWQMFEGEGTVPCPTITVTGPLDAAELGVAYSDTVSGGGGDAPYTYAVTAGALPGGLSLNGNTGAITGTPTTIETANFTITATDANACTGSQAFSIAVDYVTEVQTWVTATGEANSTILSALNTLVIGLQTNNLWNDQYAIYPFVGGTAAKHKFNLKDPQDTNGAYRITWIGGVTHDSNGVTFNGINGTGNTNFIADSLLTNSDGSLSFYQRDNRAAAEVYDFGYNGFGVISKYLGSTSYYMWGSGFGGTIACADSRGWFVTNKTATNVEGYLNTTRVVNDVQAGGVGANPIYIGSQTGVGSWSSSNYAFAHIGKTMSQANQAIYYGLIQAFQTALSRQV